MRSWLLLAAMFVFLQTAAAQNVPGEGPIVLPPPEGVPDGDKPRWASGAVGRMREILDKIMEHLEEAREERDVVKLNCVNEKLTATKGLVRISEQAEVNMGQAVTRRHVESSNHEFDKIGIALRKTEQLLAESEACVGEMSVYDGDTVVEMTMDGIPERDPTEESEQIPVISRPPVASPFQ